MKRAKDIWSLIKFAISTIIKKEPQTYKEEREQQKKKKR